jgi:hypothetical protein
LLGKQFERNGLLIPVRLSLGRRDGFINRSRCGYSHLKPRSPQSECAALYLAPLIGISSAFLIFFPIDQFNGTEQNANFILDSDVREMYGIVHTE